jgi:hypothetical protein
VWKAGWSSGLGVERLTRQRPVYKDMETRTSLFHGGVSSSNLGTNEKEG